MKQENFFNKLNSLHNYANLFYFNNYPAHFFVLIWSCSVHQINDPHAGEGVQQSYGNDTKGNHPFALFPPRGRVGQEPRYRHDDFLSSVHLNLTFLKLVLPGKFFMRAVQGTLYFENQNIIVSYSHEGLGRAGRISCAGACWPGFPGFAIRVTAPCPGSWTAPAPSGAAGGRRRAAQRHSALSARIPSDHWPGCTRYPLKPGPGTAVLRSTWRPYRPGPFPWPRR